MAETHTHGSSWIRTLDFAFEPLETPSTEFDDTSDSVTYCHGREYFPMMHLSQTNLLEYRLLKHTQSDVNIRDILSYVDFINT